MKKHKVGESKPDISKKQASFLHGVKGSCLNPYIVSKPLARIEFTNIFTKRYYDEKCWKCLNCGWKSEKIRTRTA